MTWRVGWLLGTTALIFSALPGCKLCELFHNHNGGDSPGDDKKAITKKSDGLVKIERPAPEPYAIAKHGDPASLASQRDGAWLPREKPDPNGGPDSEPRPAATDAKSGSSPAGQAKREPLVEALQCILEGRHKEALAHLEAYDPETQVFYLRALPTLTIMARKRLDEFTTAEAAVLNDQLQSLLTTLRPRTDLVIERMCYCAWVKNFGMYQPLEEGHCFVASEQPGQPGELVRLYVELRNFASVPLGSGFETKLASRIEIRDAQGKMVWESDFDAEKRQLRTLSRLNDFFSTYNFMTPNLPPGTYQLVLTIADETVPGARRVAERSLEFRVAPGSTRAR